MQTCLGWSLAPAPACTPGSSCTGTVFTSCYENVAYEYRIDCSTIGLACDPRGVCGTFGGDCDPASYGGTCDASGVPWGCESGGYLVGGTACPSLGLVCEGGSCRGTGDACQSDQYGPYPGIGCAGDTLEACVGGQRHDLDCKKYGPTFSCQVVDAVPFCGIAAECIPANIGGDVPQGGLPEPVCDDTTIVFCSAGRIERIDCADLGFTGCDLDAGYGCVPSPESEFMPP